MNKFRLLIIGLLCNLCQIINAQHTMSDQDIIAEVKCIETISTGKAHNSFFFLFRVENILEGSWEDSVICSQELFSDFGGKQIREKLTSTGRLVLKFRRSGEMEEEERYEGKLNSKAVFLQWASEPSRAESIRNLEKKLPAMDEKQNTWINLLTESNGKIFYKEKGVEKIAVEIIPGYWITAIVDK